MKNSKTSSSSRFFILLLVVFSLLMIAVLPALAQDASSAEATQGLVFTLNEDACSYSVTGYTGNAKELVIPLFYRELPVTGFKQGIFARTVTENNNGPIIMDQDVLDSLTVDKITFLSTTIQIDDSASTIPEDVVIEGYAASGAQAYAKKYARTFSILQDDPYTAGLTFSMNEDQRSYTITRYTGTDTDIVIPRTYHGLAVTELKSGVFPLEDDDSVALPGDGPLVTPDDSLIGIPTSITILSNSIKLPDSSDAFPEAAMIMGHKGSTAQAYAAQHGRAFTLLPSVTSAYIELGGDITVNYKVDLCGTDLKNAVMRFSTCFGTTNVKGHAVEGQNYVVFSFEGIGPHMISDNIRAELIVDGKIVDIVDNYSVRRYCLNMLGSIAKKNIPGYDDAKYELLGTLIADLAEYGTAAQNYTGHNVGIPANRDITGASTYDALSDAYMGGYPGKSSDPDTYLISGSMELSNVIKLRFSFATDHVSSVTVQIGDALYDADDFLKTQTTDTNGRPIYLVRSAPIYATHLEDEYTVSLRVNGTECQSMTYSVLNYIYRKQNDANADLANLVKCIRNYGLSALSIWEYENKVGSVALFISDQNLTYTDALQKALQQTIKVVDIKTLSDDPADIFDTEKYDIVIVAGIDQTSIAAKNQLKSYMENGGRLVTLGGPAFETMLYELDGQWYNRSDYFSTFVAKRNQTTLMDLSAPSITGKITISSNNGKEGTTVDVGDYGLQGYGPQLFHEVEDLASWNNLYHNIPEYELSETNEDTLAALVFYAKAMDDHTNSMYIEITDSNKSRWCTSVSLTENWEYQVLTPGDFVWWHDSAATDRTAPDFTDLTKVCVGFARTGQSITQGHHSYAISSIVLSSVPEIASEKQINVDSLAPLYELYPITNAASLVTSDNQVFVQNRSYAISDEIVSCHPGRQGLGFDNDRTSRFIPLIEVKDKDGLHSGYAAWMHVFSSTNGAVNGKLEGSMLACFSSASDEFYDKNGIAAVVDTVHAMMNKAMLVEGGTDEFIYVAEDTNHITAGLSYVDFGTAENEEAVATVALYSGNTLLGKYSTNTLTPTAVSNNILQLSADFGLAAGLPDRAVTTLMLNGKLVDYIEQSVKFWEPTPEEDRHFVYIEDGQFKKNGEIISFFGVNYMPAYGIAEPNTTLFEHYVSAASYDPDVIANDLARIKSIGMNSVSIFVYYEHMKDCNNILDLIQQCKEMGLYVNLSIRRNAYPLMNYNEQEVETLIRRLHFYENEIIYAYDIAWEPRIGLYDGSSSATSSNPGRFVGRKDWDDEWAAWIDVQYGSLAHAEALWGVHLEKTELGYPFVSDDILDDQTGVYDKVTAAYYRFIDDQVAKLMNEKMLHMQPLAPDQMITFRMSMSGSGLRTESYLPSTHCFDFQSLASTMAYMEPEGYALNPSDRSALQIAIANAYARYVQPDSPVVWKEFGRQIWDGTYDCNFDPDNAMLSHVADYYEYALEYMLRSYTSGVYAWYYAGGYRIGENSDYGIFNPDGSDRGEITALLREYAPKFINQGARPEADVFIEVERDNQNGAIFGIYEAVAEQAREAYDNGLFFDFVDANMDTADDVVYADEVYQAAVGGTAENGLYPLRYVNGMIKDFKVIAEDGNTYAEVTICNTRQSTWRANTVSIVSTSASAVSVDYTIAENVDYLENLTVRFEINGHGNVALRFEINGVPFGPLYNATVK